MSPITLRESINSFDKEQIPFIINIMVKMVNKFLLPGDFID